MRFHLSTCSIFLTMQLLGCTADVEETDDAVRIEVEVPKVEVGDKTPDLDPDTDDDIDVDTPVPGDS